VTGPPKRRGTRQHPSELRFALRRLGASTVALAVFGAIGLGVYKLGGLDRSAYRAQVVAPPASTTTTTLPPPPTEPGGGYTLFPSHRLVAFYGAANLPALGVLGQGPPAQVWTELAQAAAPFASPPTVVVPSYELIAFVAEASPGPADTYTYEVPAAEIDSYLDVVKEHGGMLILDIQPGRSSFLADAEALAPWLEQPDVGLALDPEWELAPGELPDEQVGTTTAAEINQISAWLEQLTVEYRLPQKLLMIHQFRPSMVVDKPAVLPEPNLAITFNMDGFGAAKNKIEIYQLLASDPRWFLGYKLFYTRDEPLQTPAEVMALVPPPQVIEYE
jgi:hypothetical protein